MRSRTPAFGSVTAVFHLQRTAPTSTVIHSEAKSRVRKYFQERMPYGLFVPDVP
jgi:hypothetical protein